MARVRLTADVDPDLRRRVKIAAVRDDQTVSEWVERALERELMRERAADPADEEGMHMPASGLEPQGSRKPIELRSGTISETVLEERGGRYLPPAGTKPRGSKNPPRLKDGSKISDAVIEDRR